MGVVTYTYKNGSGTISNDNIINKDSNGILESYGEKGFKYTPDKNITKSIDQISGAYRLKTPDDLKAEPNLNEFTEGTAKSDTELSTKATYYFGIDSIEAREIKYNKACGYISPEIEIGSSSYIELSVKANNESLSNTEFSIIESEIEYPIVPKELEIIKSEKLFWNLNTRFKSDNTYTQIIKENGTITSLKLSDLTSEDFNDNYYTIEYKPIKQAHLFYPSKTKIKIKVVQRCLNENDIPAIIKSITILKYGGTKKWTM